MLYNMSDCLTMFGMLSVKCLRNVYEATLDDYILAPRLLVGNDAMVTRVTGASFCEIQRIVNRTMVGI